MPTEHNSQGATPPVDQPPYPLNPGELHHLLSPHFAVLCNENREEFNQLLDELMAVYQPVNQAAFAIVRDIAIARWQILRNDTGLTNHWNLALVEQSTRPLTVVPELAELQTLDRATRAVHTGQAVAARIMNCTDKLIVRIGRLERQLRFVNTHFGTRVIEPKSAPAPAPCQPSARETSAETPAQSEPAAPDAMGEPNAPTLAEPDPSQPVFITENTPSVIAHYRQLFPGRRIVILPADNVARGIDVEDHMPDIPRRAA